MINKKLFFILFLIVFLFSFKPKAHAAISDQIIETIVGNFIDNGESNLGGGTLPSCGEIDQRLKDDFGIMMKPDNGPYGTWESWAGVVPATPDCQTKRLFYRAMSIAGKSSAYLRLLKPQEAFTIGCSMNNISGSSGWVTDRKFLHFRNCGNIKSNFEPYAFLLAHEVGHIMKQRNYALLQQGFPRANLYSLDRNCFADEGVIKTYNRRGLSSTSLLSESSAEAIALYVYNHKKGDFATINNFRNECPSIYNWVRNNVFGGYTFN